MLLFLTNMEEFWREIPEVFCLGLLHDADGEQCLEIVQKNLWSEILNPVKSMGVLLLALVGSQWEFYY